jgi:cytochrome d ubiquinol oxidase subunit II
VTSSAYLAAVYLAADAAGMGHDVLEREFRRRALAAGVVAGAIAIADLIVLNGSNHPFVHALLTGSALAAVVVSFLAGLATLALVYVRRFQTARYTAAVAVAAIIAGWAVARWPTILPGLTIHQAAAGHDTLVWLVVAVLAGGAILFPSLAILFRLTVTGRFHPAATATPSEHPPERMRTFKPRLLVRIALACLIAGFGLLTLADAGWAHAIGVVCLFLFIVTGFGAIVSQALADEPATQ